MNPLDIPIMKVCRESMTSDIILPGFGFNDMDAEDRNSFSAMAKCGTATLALTYVDEAANDPDTAFAKLTGPEALIFTKSCYYEIFPAFFENKKYQYKPVQCISQLMNLGKTSFQHHTTCISTATKAVLFSCVVVMVRVDKVTRRPAPISDEFAQTFGRRMGTRYVPKMDMLLVPEECLKVDFIANWGDCDVYRHVNQSSYLKFCQSAAEQLEWRKKLPGYNSSHVRTIQATHFAETSAGHKLTVSVWWKDQKFYFDIINENSEKKVYQAAFGTKQNSHL